MFFPKTNLQQVYILSCCIFFYSFNIFAYDGTGNTALVLGVKKKLLFFIFNNFLPDALMILKL